MKQISIQGSVFKAQAKRKCPEGSEFQHTDNRRESNVSVMLEKSWNDRRPEIKAEARRCEILGHVVFLVDKRTTVLMMGDT